VFEKYPQVQGVCHFVHPSVALAVQEWQVAEDKKHTPDVRQVNAKAIDKACTALTTSFSSWPEVLHSTNLSAQAAEQPLANQWWLTDHASDDGEDGECS
jgi:hypothetical protein